jgi:hypothetical protein
VATLVSEDTMKTRAEIKDFTKRIRAKIARGELSARPLSGDEKRRGELMRRKRDAESHQRIVMRA